MICCIIQLMGILSGAIGMVLTWIVCIMPYWRLSVMAEYNTIVIPGGRVDGEFLSRWDGLWITCLQAPWVEMRCDNYGSQVTLTADLKAGRIFMCFAIGVSVLACIFSIIGFFLVQCCPCCDKTNQKHYFTLTAGILYFIAAILVLIPVIWTTVNIARGAYEASYTRGALRLQIGYSLMLCWPDIVFLLGGGFILTFLCCICSISSCCSQDRCAERAVCKSEVVKEERASCSPRMEYL